MERPPARRLAADPPWFQRLPRVTIITFPGDRSHGLKFAAPLSWLLGEVNFHGGSRTQGRESAGEWQRAAGGESRIQAPAHLLGSHQGLQPALHPLSRHRDRTQLSHRPANDKGARHHRSDRDGCESHSCSQRRRASLSLRHFSTRPATPRQRVARGAGDQRNAGDQGSGAHDRRLGRQARFHQPRRRRRRHPRFLPRHSGSI